MHLERSIPSTLNSSQLAVVFRDLARSINHYARGNEVALFSAEKLICRGWEELPDWVRSAEVRGGEGTINLSLELVENVQLAQAEPVFENLAGQLAAYVRHPVKSFPRHVFCIGWAKTGTTSLTQALRILGLFTWQFTPWVLGLKHRSEASDFPGIDFTSIADYTAVSDLPICALFKELDQAFPGSLFVLTTRPVEEWAGSMVGLCKHLVEEHGSVGSIIDWAHGTTSIDVEKFKERYLRHEKEVLEYFGDREDLLVLDVSHGNPWKPLCRFLNLPEPDAAFPHLNRREVDTTAEPNHER